MRTRMRIPIILAVAALELRWLQRQSGGQSLVADGPRGRRRPQLSELQSV